MAKTQGEDFLHFLHQAAVFRQPVEQSAFAMFGSAALLEKGVDLTLIEREQRRGREAVYWVAPIIRDSEWARLLAEEQVAMHQLAYRWYDETLEGSPAPDYQYMEEAVHHALESGNIRGACKHVIPLGRHLADLLLYRERLQVQQQVIDHLTEAMIEEATRGNDNDIAVLLNNQGYTWNTLGEARRAIEYYEQALAIDRQVYGDTHPDVALRYNNLGVAWADLGEARRAIEYFEQALAIDRQVFGDTHPNVAIRYSNLGTAWTQLGEAHQARTYLEKALEIYTAMYGSDHPSARTIKQNLEAL
jgi:tetratricopeptide (TPR) repeat protein